MNAQARRTRVGMRFTIAPAAAILLLFCSSAIANAGVTVDSSSAYAIYVKVTGLYGGNFLSKPDTCTVWLDDMNSNPLVGGPADSNGNIDWEHMTVPNPPTTHKVIVRCYKGGDTTKPKSEFNTDEDVTMKDASANNPAPAAAPAPAAGQLSGTYTMTDSSGSADWTITPSGPGRARLVTSNGGSIDLVQAADGQWKGAIDRPDAVTCTSTGSSAPGTTNFSINPVTLIGTTSSTSKNDFCGQPAGTASDGPSFTLNKKG